MVRCWFAGGSRLVRGLLVKTFDDSWLASQFPAVPARFVAGLLRSRRGWFKFAVTSLGHARVSLVLADGSRQHRCWCASHSRWFEDGSRAPVSRLASASLPWFPNGSRQVRVSVGLRSEIADLIGSSREMVARILKELVFGRYITMENRRIVLLKMLPENF